MPEPNGPGHSGPRLGYSPAIDGFRAIAVLAVIAYHLGFAWAAGGYLGVEVFFVISGFLITALMVAEYRREGRIDLSNFWLRRARRLLPALYVLIVGLVAFMALGPSDELVDIRDDVIAALTYVTNWFLTLSDQSYFEELGRPSPLRHLWSLAIEEQWYLAWPLVFGGAMWAARGRAERLIVPMALGVVASTALMWMLYEPLTDPSRIYFGTDTRASGLLLGSLLAVVWSPWRLNPHVGPKVPAILDGTALVALLLLVLMFWRLHELDSFLYRGGLLVTGLLTSIVIAGVVHPAANLAPKLLGLKPLVWLGLRSYGLYLWHWPIIVFTRPRLDSTLDGWQLHGLRLALTLVLTELSYTYIETPIRGGALGRWWKRWRQVGVDGSTRRPIALASVCGVLVLLLAVALWRAEPPEAELATTADVADLIRRDTTSTTATQADRPTSSTTTEAIVESTDDGRGSGAAAISDTTSSTTTTTQPAPTTTTTEPRLPRTIAVTGDSVGITMAINFPRDITSIRVDNAGVEGCGVVTVGALQSQGRTIRNLEGCVGVAERWAKGARGNEVTLVTIGAWEVFDIVIDGDDVALGTTRHDELIINGLSAGVDALLAEGSEVALLEVPCYSPVDGGGLRALPERADRTRTGHISELINRVAASHAQDVHVLVPPDEFCTDPDVGDDVNLRWDGVHYGPLGGAFIWARLEADLLAIPVDYSADRGFRGPTITSTPVGPKVRPRSPIPPAGDVNSRSRPSRPNGSPSSLSASGGSNSPTSTVNSVPLSATLTTWVPS
ncbi:MAG: acyltransferase [Actinomycetia bacterium]|nr:acyltransferase [Actinomycetes bacterium]